MIRMLALAALTFMTLPLVLFAEVFILLTRRRLLVIVLVLAGVGFEAPQARAAINAAAVWRVDYDSGNGASDNNGAGYDATISGAGVDYTNQTSAAAIATFSDITTTGANNTLHSILGGFTANMVGNAIRIRSGTSFTAGYYFIVTYTDTNTVVVDRTPATGAGSLGTGNVGGRALTIKKLMDSANAANEKVVAGNTIMLRGAGSDSPSSDDYTNSGYFVPVSGTAGAGYVKLLGYNGRPRIASDGLTFYVCQLNWFENLYLRANSTSNGSYGMVNANGTNCFLRNVVINVSVGAMIGATLNSSTMVDCEVFGAASSKSAGNHGVAVTTYHCKVIGCYIHNCWDVGVAEINSGSGSEIRDNLIVSNKGDGVDIITTAGTAPATVIGNTIYGNGGDGINVISGGTFLLTCMNNILDTNGGYGLNCAGTLALNDRLNQGIDYNNFNGNTTAARNGISVGTHDTALSPGFTNVGSFDWSIGTNLKALGFPGLIRKSATTSYVDIGAAQRQEAGGAAGILVNKGTSGGTQ